MADVLAIVLQVEAEYERVQAALRIERQACRACHFCPDKLPLILVVDDDKTMRILLRR